MWNRLRATLASLRLRFAKRVGGERTMILDGGAPVFFRILKIDAVNRRIHFETLYWPFAEDRLSDFGAFSHKYRTTRLGYGDMDGSLHQYFYTRASLNVAPIYDFQKAVDRAVGLSSMDLADVRAQVNERMAGEEDMPPRNPAEALIAALTGQSPQNPNVRIEHVEKEEEPEQEQESDEPFSDPRGRHTIAINSNQGMRQIVIETALPDFIDRLYEIGIVVHQMPVTEDDHIWRYIIDVPMAISFDYALYVCSKEAERYVKEMTETGNTWDIWRK